jgi:dienelactone hydrolase
MVVSLTMPGLRADSQARHFYVSLLRLDATPRFAERAVAGSGGGREVQVGLIRVNRAALVAMWIVLACQSEMDSDRPTPGGDSPESPRDARATDAARADASAAQGNDSGRSVFPEKADASSVSSPRASDASVDAKQPPPTGAVDAAPQAAGDAAVSDAAQATSPDGAPRPDPKFLVAATGPCPEFRDGYVMFSPDGKPRRVLLYATSRPNMNGPLVFFWHSTLPNPEDALGWIGRTVIEEIKAQGGVVVAPTTADRSARRPWDHTPLGPTNSDADQRLMDEVVACAIAKVGIDVRRIHSTGMSAGGQKTAQVSLRRSGYLASVVVYSGGLPEGDEPPDQDPSNPVAAMILYGGRTDISPVDGENYTQASTRYRDLMVGKGRFAFLCNHGGGHTVPTDSQASAWRFMQDHPYGTKPSPYAKAFPSGFLRYCVLDGTSPP